jgi:hypothetical protein
MTNKPKPRLFFTDPLKALYMMKEFGVKFYTKGFLDVESDFLEKELGFHLEIRTLYNKLCQVNLKIYVAKESEHIFEPKKGDEGRWLRKIGAHYANYNGEQWVSAGIEPNPPEIIMRDNKQFFMPEVEND